MLKRYIVEFDLVLRSATLNSFPKFNHNNCYNSYMFYTHFNLNKNILKLSQKVNKHPAV